MRSVLVPGIAASLAEWEIPHVELAVHGTADAALIARALDLLCVQELGSAPCELLFYRSSVGAVAGMRLQDGRRVVVKAHQPSTSRRHLDAVVCLQGIVAAKLGLAPQVIAGPLVLGRGLAMVEELIERGSTCNGHDPVVRRQLARSLHAIVECLSTKSDATNLAVGPLLETTRSEVWPTPHSKLFDFAASTAGAEYIDAVAIAARARMPPVGRWVIGHGDWRAEHVRVAGEEVTIGFDWDSLCRAREPALVGATAHMFCADWSREDHDQAPTLEEARAFVADYEAAAGKRFAAEERQLLGTTFAFAVAYTCRCGHAAGVDARSIPGNFQHLLASEGHRLLEL